MDNHPKIEWPSSDHTRIPCDVYLDQAIFEQEQELIFKGPHWHLLGIKADIPKPGDFVSTYIGTTPIVLHRAHDDSINAYVNSCAHRGARVIRELRGNNKFPVCPYHNWRYDGTGKLTGVALEKGMKNKGGYPEGFDKNCHGLQTLKIETIKDVIFGSLNKQTPPLIESLGKVIYKRIEHICKRKLRVVGYQRQTLHCNWKIYTENNRDVYHAPQLHTFLGQFGVAKPVDRVRVDIHQAHSLLSSWLPESDEEDFPAQKGRFELEDASILEGFDPLDGLQLSICCLYPSDLLSCLRNNWILRRIIPNSVDKTDVEYTWFGYEDNSEFERECIKKQSNISGPAGYVGMEDAEIVGMIQNAISKGDTSYIEFGGAEIETSSDHMNSEGTVRAFWKGYCESMNIPTS
jgi:anthranilate 1,2-dioxygenase large subunit